MIRAALTTWLVSMAAVKALVAMVMDPSTITIHTTVITGTTRSTSPSLIFFGMMAKKTLYPGIIVASRISGGLIPLH
jgi:hypothetical protein